MYIYTYIFIIYSPTRRRCSKVLIWISRCANCSPRMSWSKVLNCVAPWFCVTSLPRQGSQAFFQNKTAKTCITCVWIAANPLLFSRVRMSVQSFILVPDLVFNVFAIYVFTYTIGFFLLGWHPLFVNLS